MWPPEPRRGGKKIAQGKAAAAAALGKETPQPTSLFSFFGLARCRRARPKKEKKGGNHFGFSTRGGARSSLAPGWDAAPHWGADWRAYHRRTTLVSGAPRQSDEMQPGR